MKRKGFSNVVVKVGARASALIALSLAIPVAVSLSSCDREQPNCPKKTVEEPKGIEVLIDYEDVATGETTRSLANGRSLGRLGEGFDVEADGLKLYGITYDKSDNPLPINPELTFYAKENVVFQGWSWRYGTDKPGTQRDSEGNIISDYIATPALQPDAGQHKLDLSTDKTSFTCKYDPNSDNKVYVKVKYKHLVPEDIVRSKVNLNPIYIPRTNMNKDLIGWTGDRYAGDNNIDYNKIELPLQNTTIIREYDYVSPTQNFVGKQENTYSEFVIDCAMDKPSILDGVPSDLRKFKVKMKISGVVTPIARFVYQYEDGSVRDRFVCYRKILSKRHKFDNLAIDLTMPAEHHGTYISSWTKYDGRTLILSLMTPSLYDSEVNKEELKVRESYARSYGVKGLPMDYKCWYLANKGDWKITEATIEPIIYGDKVYMFDCTTY